MSEILQELIPAIISTFVTGAAGSILYWRQNKKLKDAEVRASELDNKNKELDNKNKEISSVANVNSEWERMSDKLSKERQELVDEIHTQAEIIQSLHDKIDDLNAKKEKAWENYSNSRIECAKKDRLISELNWYRCEINNCQYRKPPRKYGDFNLPENAVVKADDEEKNEN